MLCDMLGEVVAVGVQIAATESLQSTTHSTDSWMLRHRLPLSDILWSMLSLPHTTGNGRAAARSGGEIETARALLDRSKSMPGLTRS